MELTELTATSLARFFSGGCSFLAANKDIVDALNVFPVPDGDTGTNMSLTMNSAVRDLAEAESTVEVAEAVSTGALMGARGNSGVILSQLFRGFAQGVGDKKQLNAVDLAASWHKGVELAYKSVMKPVEGTILTVSKAFAAGAAQQAKTSTDLFQVLDFALAQGQIALDNTPNQLLVLRQAGVVDAGGKGFLLIMEGGLKALRGEITETLQPMPEKSDLQSRTTILADIPFQYCTEMIIKGEKLNIDDLKSFLAEKGDSLLVVGTEQLVKIHLHTNHPGEALEHALAKGTLHDIKIENMKEQHRETLIPATAAEEVNCAVVAVAAGEGLASIFTSLGVAKVISGGQTMNPSAEELVSAIRSLPAKQVLILPNNSNIILTAEQAKMLAGKPVAVVPSKTLPQGLAAMLTFEEAQSLAENAAKMTLAMAHVKTGEITYAVRDSVYDGMAIKENEILGLFDGAIKTKGLTVDDVVLELTGMMVTPADELITLFYGNGTSPDSAESLAAKLRDAFPKTDVEVHFGGQPLYYYLISVE